METQDAHQSEYVADHDKRREWLTGFTGSAGTALVTSSKALMWTDGRYFLQVCCLLCVIFRIHNGRTRCSYTGYWYELANDGGNDRRQEGVNVPRALELLALKSCPRSFFICRPLRRVQANRNFACLAWTEDITLPASHYVCVFACRDHRVEQGSRVLRCFSPVPQHEKQTCQRVHPPAEVSPRPNPCSDIYETLKHYILVAICCVSFCTHGKVLVALVFFVHTEGFPAC